MRDVVAVEAFTEGLRFFLVDGRSTPQARYIARAVTAAARHYVEVDPEHLKQLQILCRRLGRDNRGLAVRNRDRLRQFDNPANVRALLDLPGQIIAQARRAKVIDRKVALNVQSAIAIELLLMLPMRIHNLAGLRIGEHLIRSREGLYHIAIPGDQVKNGADIEAGLPSDTAKLLDLYIRTYRPFLKNAASPFLFPGRYAAAKSCDAMREQITVCIKSRCGLLVNPHLFRHFAAKVYLDANPGGYGVIRQLHGHKSVNTTTLFYCGMETAAAIAHFDQHVLRVRGTPATRPRVACQGSQR